MTDARLTRNEPAATGLRRLYFDAVLPEYRHPGQFLSIDVGGRSAFFAIASSPGEPIELLVKAEGPVGGAVAELVPGAVVPLDGPIGQGFPIHRAEGLPLVLFVNGSGISAARPVIRAELGKRPLTLLYGVITPDRRPFLADLEDWANRGVQVHTVVERAEGTGWTGHTGWVQDAAVALGLVRPDVGVLMIGVPRMIDAVRALYAAAGADPDRVMVNY